LSEIADFQYKCTALYDPASDAGVAWNAPELAIEWPVSVPLLSEKDRQLPMLKDADRARLP
jgi:dTDP-4-dehydrorhamnose 3,5-epimerase